MVIEPYTVALTSCGRFDLLEQTLASLLPRLEGPFEKLVIVEDSGKSGIEVVIDKFRNSRFEIEIIANMPPIGQVGSIDRMYSNIQTEWVFHCEDDWIFYNEEFISTSFAIMKEFDSCSTVALTGLPGESACYLPEAVARCGVPYFVANGEGRIYGGFHFGPGLRRIRDYRIVGPYSDVGLKVGEGPVARIYRDLGYRVFFVNRPFIRHIGRERHVRDPIRHPNFRKRLNRSLNKHVKRFYWMLKRNANPKRDVELRFKENFKMMENWIDWNVHSRSNSSN